MKTKTAIITGIIFCLALVFLVGCGKTPNLDEFAKCTAEKGMTFYGTYWCPHCANVKHAFGDSMQYVNYVECDPKGPKGQPEKCAKDGIDLYPSFIFADGIKITGEMSLAAIAEKTGCTLPE